MVFQKGSRWYSDWYEGGKRKRKAHPTKAAAEKHARAMKVGAPPKKSTPSRESGKSARRGMRRARTSPQGAKRRARH